MRSPSRLGSGLSSTPRTTLKIAVFAPMPSASVMMTTDVKAGLWRSARNANLTIVRDARDPRQAALIAHRVHGDRYASRREQSLSPRVVGMHAAPNVLGRLHLHVRLELFAQLVLGAWAGGGAAKTRPRTTKATHTRFAPRREKGGDQLGGLVPLSSLARELLPPRGGQRSSTSRDDCSRTAATPR